MAWHDADNYLLVERDGIDSWAIRITSGEYSGIEYSYGEVSLAKSEDGSAALPPTLSFKYILHEIPESHDKKELESSVDFGNYIGDILVDIIMGDIEENQNGSELRNNDTSESTDQRAVRSSGYTISEG